MLGHSFPTRRSSDLAAIAAVSDLTNADKAASATIQRNNLAADTSHVLEFGTYTADASLPSSRRFQASSSANANSARVTLTTSTPLYFGRVLTGRSNFSIQTTATATRSAFATFAIGSRLLAVDGGLLNQVLGGLLGSSLSLSVMDYQSLINAKIDLFNFMDALATRLSLTGVTYDSLLNSNIKIGQFMAAMADSGRQTYGSTSTVARALSDVSQSVQGLSTKLRVGSVIDVGPYSSMTVGQRPKSGVSASALDMLTATAQIANGQHQIEAALNLNIPGIASASLKLAIGERPQGTSWITVGAEGASVHTAQTRLLLTVQLVGSGPVSLVTLPIYLELASGTAKLTSLKCGFPDVSKSTVTLGVTPAVIDAWIGDVSNTDFNNFKSAPNPPAAKLVNTPILNVTARSHVTVTNLSAQPVTFSYADITQVTKKTVGTHDFAASLLSKLVGDAQLNANILGLGIGLPQALTSSVANILATAVSPVDQLLTSVLNTLGVGLGQADVWVSGIRCDGAVLVN